jgi:DNA-binding NarL/FixJ family response regulator
MKTATLIKVMIVDDHPLVRVGMATVIDRQRDMKTVALAEDGDRLLEVFLEHRPDVVLMDLRLRTQSGAQLTASLREKFREARVIMISNYEGDADIQQAIAAGAMGYLFKSIVEDELVDAIREVHAGRQYLPNSVTARLQEHGVDLRLTTREDEILELLGKGLRNREMADVLGVTDETVKSHLKSIFRKLAVSDRAEAVREAIARGFIRPV